MRKPQILVIIQMILFAVMVALALTLPASSRGATRVLGLILMTSGAIVGLAAIMQHPKGPNISPEPKHSSDLIQTGLYRHIRHPIYTGVLIGTLGVALFHGHLAMFVLVAVFLSFFTMKSRYEETLLKTQYANYVTYMRYTGRFLPPVKLPKLKAAD